MLPAWSMPWEMPNMSESGELRGRALYDALMVLRPANLPETEWAVQSGVNRGFFTNLKNSDISPRSDTLRKLLHRIGRTEADLYQKGAIPSPSLQPDIPQSRDASEGEVAGVRRWDLSYAMGPGTNVDEDYLEGDEVLFDIGFLRSLTVSAPSQLRLVSGSGDSMLPTIHDREELILDLGQKRLNMQDRIWAISLFGAGALKRLRTIGQDRVLVISDNPDVPDQEVSADDIAIVGRLVGSVKRH